LGPFVNHSDKVPQRELIKTTNNANMNNNDRSLAPRVFIRAGTMENAIPKINNTINITALPRETLPKI
jgi:hypothetical protein